MPNDDTSWSLRADWLIPGDGRTIRNGVLRGRGSIIETVGPASEVAPAENHRDLPGMAVLPGLVNAHTHLELSHLRGKLPRRASMPRWILSLLRQRGTSKDQLAAVAAGAAEALATGTTTVVDISHNNSAWRVLSGRGTGVSPASRTGILPVQMLRALCLAEVIGTGPTQRGAINRLLTTLEGIPSSVPPTSVSQLVGAVEQHPQASLRYACGWHRSASPTEPPTLAFGIIPHAPYSTAPSVYKAALEIATQRGWPICTHLAETKGERQFLAYGRGAFWQFAQTLGLIDESTRSLGCKPMEFAKQVGLLDALVPVILAHVNYIDDDELVLLAASWASRTNIGATHKRLPACGCGPSHTPKLRSAALGGATVVYCPGSATFFGHRGHRYAEMLSRGINVALGTDSLASNDALDMLAEMRRLKKQGQVDNHTILRMATLNGAIAMGWQNWIGTLEPGKQADWIAVRSEPVRARRDDPLEAILRGMGKVTRVAVAGELAFSLLAQ